MESLFLVNPRGKKRRKGKMPAGLRRYWAAKRRGGGKRRRRKARAVMANPRRRHSRRRHRNPVVRSYRRRAARRRNPFKRRRVRHHNPFKLSGLKDMVIPAAIGAGGAIATSIAYGYVSPSLPASLQTGYVPALIKGAVAVALGMLAGKFLGRDRGRAVTLGGLTVVIVGVVTPMITSAAPTLPGLSGLNGMADYVPYSRPGMGAYLRNPKLGAYLPKSVPGMKGLGFVSPAAVIQPTRPANANMGDWNGWQNDGM